MAWWAGTLTASGALAAAVVGALILGGAGWEGGAVLAVFFVSSTLLPRIVEVLDPAGRSHSGTATSLLDPKGDRRDPWQVWANGGAAALSSILPLDQQLRLWLITASLATAAADTWATTIGLRSRVPPRLWGLGRVVVPGTNGGMTLIGSAAGLLGAALVAGGAAMASGSIALLPWGTLIGFFGMVLDSVLGGTVQGRFYCPRCQQPSEWRVHRCGTATRVTGGWVWLNNDGVNFLATALAASAAGIVWWVRD